MWKIGGNVRGDSGYVRFFIICSFVTDSNLTLEQTSLGISYTDYLNLLNGDILHLWKHY